MPERIAARVSLDNLRRAVALAWEALEHLREAESLADVGVSPYSYWQDVGDYARKLEGYLCRAEVEAAHQWERKPCPNA